METIKRIWKSWRGQREDEGTRPSTLLLSLPPSLPPSLPFFLPSGTVPRIWSRGVSPRHSGEGLGSIFGLRFRQGGEGGREGGKGRDL